MRKVSEIFDNRIPYEDFDAFDTPPSVLKSSPDDLKEIADKEIYLDANEELSVRIGNKIKKIAESTGGNEAIIQQILSVINSSLDAYFILGSDTDYNIIRSRSGFGLYAKDANATNETGKSVRILSGAGDGTGDSGDIISEVGNAGGSGNDGRIIDIGDTVIRQKGGTVDVDELQQGHNGTDGFIKSMSGVLKNIATKLRITLISDETKYVDVYHDGTDGFIETSAGDLKTNNKNIKVGTAKVKFDTIELSESGGELITGNKILNTGSEPIKASGATLSGLTASQIVETDIGKKLVSAAKGTAYNKSFGTGATDVCAGNDSRLSDSRQCNNNFDSAATARGNLMSEQTFIADPAGGTTVDAEARAAINGILDILIANDLMAAS